MSTISTSSVASLSSQNNARIAASVSLRATPTCRRLQLSRALRTRAMLPIAETCPGQTEKKLYWTDVVALFPSHSQNFPCMSAANMGVSNQHCGRPNLRQCAQSSLSSATFVLRAPIRERRTLHTTCFRLKDLQHNYLRHRRTSLSHAALACTCHKLLCPCKS